MRVSVVLCTYTMDMYPHFEDAADSVLEQTHDDVELVVVVDGDEEVYERVREAYGEREDTIVHCNEGNRGLSYSRNRGIERSTGDVVAFLDDDAIAEPNWVAELVAGYERRDALAVGGTMTPIWVAGEPDFLPEEFYWLVGVTHRGYPTAEQEVRNTFGSNISFRRHVLETLGGFDNDLGRKGDEQGQGEETELAVRLYREYGERVWYVPDARVGHKVFDYRTDPKWLLNRAFQQGYSKRAMADVGSSSGAESDFLKRLMFEFAPARARELVRTPSLARVEQFVMVFVFTFVVGMGYLYGVFDY